MCVVCGVFTEKQRISAVPNKMNIYHPFYKVSGIDRSKKTAVVIGAKGKTFVVKLSDVPPHMFEKGSNYEPLEVEKWTDYPDVFTCKHEIKHPSILDVDRGWIPECVVKDWGRLVKLPSKDVPNAMRAQNSVNDCAITEPVRKIDTDAYEAALVVLRDVLENGKVFALETIYEAREKAWDRVVTRKNRDWHNLYLQLTPEDLKIILSEISDVFFGQKFGPERWCRARKLKLGFEMMDSLDPEDALKMAGECGRDATNLTIRANKAWLRDHTNGIKSIEQVGGLECTHPFDCFMHIIAHEFVHMLVILFVRNDDSIELERQDNGHGPVWIKFAKGLFGFQNRNFTTFTPGGGY